MQPTLKNIYDKYSPIIYGIALDITQSEEESEEVLIATFQHLRNENLIQKKAHCLCATLIRLLVITLHKRFSGFTVKGFKSTPLVHKLLCENNLTYVDLSIQTRSTRAEVAKKIRKEISSLKLKTTP